MNLSRTFRAALAAAALVTAASCTSQDDDVVPAEYTQAEQLWKKLLHKNGTEEAAAMDPAAADVRVLLNHCRKTDRRGGVQQDDLCGEFYARIDAAKKRAQQSLMKPAAQKFRPADALAAASRGSSADAPAADSAPQPAPVQQPVPAPDAPKPPEAKKADEAPQTILPKPGMKAGEFKARFGACFTQFSELTVTGVGTGQAMILNDDEDCRAVFPGFENQAVLIAGGAVESIRSLDELNPTQKTLYGNREITQAQKDCLEKSQEREKQGLSKLPCLPGDDPYGPAADDNSVAIESL